MNKYNRKLTVIFSVCIMGVVTQATAAELENVSTFGNATLNNKHYSAVSISGNLDADKIIVVNQTSVSGNVDLRNSQLHAIAISGHAKLTDSKIDGKMNISGSLTVNHSMINGSALNCSGDLHTTQSTYGAPIRLSGNLNTNADTFNQQLTISGNLAAEHSVFNKDITISSFKSIWKNSQLKGNIVDNSMPSISGIPTLILEHSTVEGNVDFTKTKGLVLLKGNSKINGKIENAEVKTL